MWMGNVRFALLALLFGAFSAHARCTFWYYKEIPASDAIVRGYNALAQLENFLTRVDARPSAKADRKLTLAIAGASEKITKKEQAQELLLGLELCRSLESAYDHVQVVMASVWKKQDLLDFLARRGKRGDHFAFVGHNGILGQHYLTQDGKLVLPQSKLLEMGFPKVYLGGCSSKEDFSDVSKSVDVLAYEQDHSEVFFLARYPDALVNDRPAPPTVRSAWKDAVWKFFARTESRVPVRVRIP